MQRKTLLNRVLRHSAFGYVAERLVETVAGPSVAVQLRARANSRPRCSRCAPPGPGYDTLPPRRFEFVPLWGLKVFFLYAPRRVSGAHCGVRVEARHGLCLVSGALGQALELEGGRRGLSDLLG